MAIGTLDLKTLTALEIIERTNKYITSLGIDQSAISPAIPAEILTKS